MQNLASVQPRTSPVKFARSLAVQPRGGLPAEVHKLYEGDDRLGGLNLYRNELLLIWEELVYPELERGMEVSDAYFAAFSLG